MGAAQGDCDGILAAAFGAGAWLEHDVAGRRRDLAGGTVTTAGQLGAARDVLEGQSVCLSVLGPPLEQRVDRGP